MAGQSPVPPKKRSAQTHKSPYNKKYRDYSDSKEDVDKESSGYEYNLRSKSPSSDNVSDVDNSLQDESDNQETSYTKSPPKSGPRDRSRITTHTKFNLSASPGSTKKGLYPDLTDHMAGDGLDYKDDTNYARSKMFAKSQDKREQREEEEQHESSYNSNTFLFGVLGILVVLVVFLAVGPWFPKPPVEDADVSVFEKYSFGIDDISSIFPQQSPRLWRTLKSSAKHVLNATDPEYPVVVLLGAPAESSRITKCIALKVASLFESSLTGHSENMQTSDMNQYKNLQDRKQKETLDNEMMQTFVKKGGKSFVIVNLQALAPEAALILHGYCDNDNAPYKDVMILMTLHFSRQDLKLDGKQTARREDVETYLRSLWIRGLVEDKVGALLSRVGNNIVVVADEKNDIVQRHCPS